MSYQYLAVCLLHCLCCHLLLNSRGTLLQDPAPVLLPGLWSVPSVRRIVLSTPSHLHLIVSCSKRTCFCLCQLLLVPPVLYPSTSSWGAFLLRFVLTT
ncbi:hypothetical protein BDW66DRAFT_77142 [Aspergillus desertorum]